MEGITKTVTTDPAGITTVDSKCVVEMVNAQTAAAIVGVSRRSWWRFVSEGRAPQPIRLGRCVRWRLAEIRRWISDGCRS
jgi:predicted DNA-binding transcriptional regulator AlpA